MAHILESRVKETTTTTGTGTITLANVAPTGFRTFDSFLLTGDTTYYAIVMGAAWEIGLGTYDSTGPTLARTAVQSSSNADALVNFAAGTKDVFVTMPGSRSVFIDGQSAVPIPLTTLGFTPVASSGYVSLFGRTVATRAMLGQVGPNGLDSVFQPFIARNKVGYWNPPGNAATLPGVFGITAFTPIGIATARNVATTSLATRMRRIGYPSNATAGATGGARINVAQFSCGSAVANDGTGFMLIERFVENDPAPVNTRRAFAGVASSLAVPTNVEPNTLTNSVGIIQLSTDATQWYWYQSGSAAQTAVAIGTAIGAPGGNSTTAWELAIFCPASKANFYYLQLTNLTTGVAVETVMTGAATVVPQSSTLLAWRHWVTNNASALVAGVDMASLYIETDT